MLQTFCIVFKFLVAVSDFKEFSSAGQVILGILVSDVGQEGMFFPPLPVLEVHHFVFWNLSHGCIV